MSNLISENDARPERRTIDQGAALIAADGVIFDLDGTLWDTRAVCARAWNCAIGRSGLDLPEITAETLSGIMGLEPQEIAEQILAPSQTTG